MFRIVVVLVVATGAADARGFRRAQVPNGTTLTCETCHVAGQSRRVRNPFGMQVEQTLVGQDADWSALFDLDADGDGFTNGLELGDPDGVWQPGQPNPPLVSHPGNAADHPPLPDMFVPEPDAAALDPDAAVAAPDAAMEADAGADASARAPDAIGVDPLDDEGGGDGSAGCQGVPAPWPWLPLLFTLRYSRRAPRPRAARS